MKDIFKGSKVIDRKNAVGIIIDDYYYKGTRMIKVEYKTYDQTYAVSSLYMAFSVN